MNKIEPKIIQELLNQIVLKVQEIQKAGNDKRNRLGITNYAEVQKQVPLKPDSNDVDETAWTQFPMDKQEKLFQELQQLSKSLLIISELDGPTEPNHIMYDEYASTATIVSIAILGFAIISFLLIMISHNWNQATGNDFTSKIQVASTALGELKSASDSTIKMKAIAYSYEKKGNAAQDSVRKAKTQDSISKLVTIEKEAEKKAQSASVEAIKAIVSGGPSEKSVLIMVILLGALGGSIHLISSLVKFVGNRQLKRSWILYYFATPFIGAGLAPIIYMLLRIGILTPTGAVNAGTSISNLNLMVIFAFAALTGLFAKMATEKLAEVFGTLFKTNLPQSKDPIVADKKPGVK